jgi:acetoin utilization deacetylase AcuC-like enzyme
VRTDWSREEIAALFDLPFGDLMFEAQSIHRANFPRNEVQLSTLLSIKTGGCAEDCGYCSQSAHHNEAKVPAGKLMGVDEVVQAAQAARDAGIARVAILDIDYHHGNGTQDIFWDRGDVIYASVHADPATDFPFYWGHADEVGEGAGAGATLNLPLPQGTTIAAFRAAQTTALEAIARFDPGLLIVSFGADTFEGDPIANFALKTSDYAMLAQDIAATGLPTVVLTEGGYAVDNLGENVASFLSGF